MSLDIAKPKIAVLGGGVGAVAAAFALTEGPNRGKYDITVYQLGWRLGGKGASGRNEAINWRIEEHGVHVWFGFYYNAVRLMQQCYASQGWKWEDGFTPHDRIVLEERVNGGWQHLPMEFPRGNVGHPPPPWAYIEKALKWILEQLGIKPAEGPRIHDAALIRPIPDSAPPAEVLARLTAFQSEAASCPPEIRSVVATLDAAVIGGLGGILERAWEIARRLTPGGGPAEFVVKAWLLPLIDIAQLWLRDVVEPLAKGDDFWRRTYVAVDLALAVVHGMIADGVIWKGFDAIDSKDLWPWLKAHHASSLNEHSPFVQSLYAQAFAFLEGDVTKRTISAAVALRAGLRLVFAYEGPLMWKMNAGMGDIVFAPFYLELRRRGVKFEFFHRVESLHLKRRRIDSVVLKRQVRLKDPAKPYEPLVDVPDPRVGSRKCWPNAPRWDQLDAADVAEIQQLMKDPKEYVNLESAWSSWGPQREKESITLRDGKDFDHVVLGLAPGAFPDVCGELIKADKNWERMVETVATVRTQSFQLWLEPSLKTLGYPHEGPVTTAYVSPVDTWAEMNQTRCAEPWPDVPEGCTKVWPEGMKPGLIAYFCGVFPDSEEPPKYQDPSFPRRMKDLVFTQMKTYLENDIGYMWPKGAPNGQPNALDLSKLLDLNGGVGIDRLKRQFWVANIDPTERYVQSVPGTTQNRLFPDKSGFDNLFLAGDWTRNTLNAGAVEAAMTSGMWASRGISGYPTDIIGEEDR